MTPPPETAPKTLDLLRHLAGRPGHDEVKAGFRHLLIDEFGADLDSIRFEHRVPEVRGRLDALIGHTVFEAKRDLDAEWRDVERRMPDYLADRERAEGERFVGIASDGRNWALMELAAGKLAVIKRAVLDPDQPGPFLAWLDGALALKSSLPPDPLTIRAELGQDSLAFHRVDGELRLLWDRLKSDPAVALKRDLWAELLKQVYGREVEGDALWFQHSFLVVVAKCIALAVMGLPEEDPVLLLSGEAFQAAGIHGAVESDFFDWVVADDAGRALVRRIMTHVRRFRLAEVESDVLKILYESLIDRDERHGLGEYYTPDWLAAKVIRHSVERPLEQRVLDPACGSGTFLFHAIRHFLAEAVESGMDPDRRALEVCDHVAGTDIHPVAVIIARVTYLLALAPALSARTGGLSIPVYLGDAMQLSISEFMAGKELTIRVPPPPAGDGQSGTPRGDGREQLDFPDTFCRDPALFDKAIERMRTGSEQDMTRAQIEKALHKITEQHYRADVTREQELAIQDLGKTYVTFDRLRREGRDTVWAYVARNLSRPLAYSAAGGWAQVVVGNPPWVALRHMNADLQKRFKELAKGERVFVGGKFATQNDLCALFAVRAAHLYLRSGGRLALVLPMAALTRGQFEPLRKGSFHSVRIAWDEAWTMDDRVQPLFPVPSCVVFGRRRALAQPLPDTVRAYSGSLPLRDAPESVADARLSVTDGAPALEVGSFTGGSAYRKAFRQGATLVPRMLCFVERKVMGRLGADPSAPNVVSRRSSQEKQPWKDLPGIESRVEAEFLRPILLGESIVPYRVIRPLEGVIPVADNGAVLDAEGAINRGIGHLNTWMRKAEAVWDANSESKGMTLIERWNYHNELGAQFPNPLVRVAYAASGTQPAACLVREQRAVVEHKLYWTAPASEAEGQYLIAILNSETIRERAERFQSRGQWGARDFDKVAFNLPIPRFDAEDPLHQALVQAAQRAEALAALVELPDAIPFQRARALVRRALTDAAIAPDIDALVARLLDDAGV
ncbi:N-6 DNA methylase [Azospirillum sp.]|uniref:N-6 DNA methylase n=1 Tax=Azospirillum sp. TaxID=34012 RepID=UPI00262881A5|nr:N-6 DNA methylase [Azospirillum sp.]